MSEIINRFVKRKDMMTMTMLMMKLSALKWVFFPFIALLGVSHENYSDYFNEHWESIIGGTVGSTYAIVDTVQTLQSSKVTYDFGHDMYLLIFTVIKAACVVFVSLYTAYRFKKKYPEPKK